MGTRYELALEDSAGGRATASGEGHGEALGELNTTWGMLRSKVRLAGRSLRLRRCFLSSLVALEDRGRVLVEAKKPGLLTRTYTVRSAEGVFRLETDGVFLVSHRLLHGQRCVGRIRRSGVLRTTWGGTFDDDLSLELCAFVLMHLAQLEQEHTTAVAAS